MKALFYLSLTVCLAATLYSADPDEPWLEKSDGVGRVKLSGKVTKFDSISKTLTICDFTPGKSKYEIKISEKTTFKDKRGVPVTPYQLGPDFKLDIVATNVGGIWNAIDIRPWIQEVGDPIITNKPNYFLEKPIKPRG
jgi:hypothetical protein